jgi:oligopeptidase B
MKIRALAGGLIAFSLFAHAEQPQPPVAKVIPHPTNLGPEFCDQPVNNQCVRQDDYFWLRDQPKDPKDFRADVIEYIQAENAYTNARAAEFAGLRSTVHAELKARAMSSLSFDSSYVKGGYLYYKRQEPGQNYPKYYRKKDGDPNAQEELLLDVPALAGDAPYFGLELGAVSPDGKQLVYGVDRFGYREGALYVKNLETGETRTIRAEGAKIALRWWQAVWSADGRYLFYTVPGTLSRDSQVVRYDLAEGKETSVFDELDGNYYLFAKATASGKYILLYSDGTNRSRVRIIPTADPTAQPVPLTDEGDVFEYSVDHVGDRFYIVSGHEGGDRDVYVAPESSPRKESWKRLLPGPVMKDITDWKAFKSHLVLLGVDKAFQRAKIVDLATLGVKEIKTRWEETLVKREDGTPDVSTDDTNPRDKVYAVAAGENPSPDAAKFRYTHASLRYPGSLREVDLVTGKVTELSRKTYPGFKPTDYATRRVWTLSETAEQCRQKKAADPAAAARCQDTRVPTDLIYRKGIPHDGKGPLYLYVYGNYGSSQVNIWNYGLDRVSLLDRGVTVAVSYPRGGGELGYQWGVDGNMRGKIDSFKDVIAVTRDLVARGFGARDRVAFEGISAAGLVTGYIANTEPTLFKAIVQGVPFVDLINTMSDASIPLTTQEYVVWGNPGIAEDYKYMMSYSPYDNVGKHEYPALLVTSALGDSQVPYWEAAKWVARIRANKTDQNPLLLAMGMVGGHGGGSGVEGPLDEAALHWSFVLSQIGTREPQPLPARAIAPAERRWSPAQLREPRNPGQR